MPALDPALETFLELCLVGIAIRAVFDFSITSFQLLKRVPRNGFLTRTEKNRREPYKVNSMTIGWYSFRSWSKIHSLLQIQFLKL